MCHQVTCATCAKPTWSGCGAHIEQALAGVSPSDRCTCGAWSVDASIDAASRRSGI